MGVSAKAKRKICYQVEMNLQSKVKSGGSFERNKVSELSKGMLNNQVLINETFALFA